MSKHSTALTATVLAISINVGAALVTAQQVSRPAVPGAIETVSEGPPASQSVSLDPRQKQELNFVVRIFGSVAGRVFDETDTAFGTADRQGISGVKVTLRSRDPGFERFVFEQYTDASGTYDFQDLRPGKYKIEIDPATLPASYRQP